jgi:hypothetical protein
LRTHRSLNKDAPIYRAIQHAGHIDLMIRARAILGVDDDAVVSVSEHDCGDPECRGVRTVILIMRPDRPTEAIKINKPLEALTAADLSDALAPLVSVNNAPTVQSRPK